VTLPQSWQPQQRHLSEVVREHGSGDAIAPVRALLEYGLARQLEAEAEARRAEGKEFKTNAYVSDSGRCPRQIYFSLTNTPQTEPLTLDSWMTLNIGKLAESLYIKLLEAAGVTILAQERVELESDGEKITGRLDLLLEIPENLREAIQGLDPRELWELKTKNSRALGWMLKRGGPDTDDPYRKQCNGYLHAAAQNKIPRPTQAKARLVYCASGATKGEPLFHVWTVNYDKDGAEEDLKILGQAMQDAKNGLDPGVPVAYRSCPNWPCNYCSWKRLCHPR